MDKTLLNKTASELTVHDIAVMGVVLIGVKFSMDFTRTLIAPTLRRATNKINNKLEGLNTEFNTEN